MHNYFDSQDPEASVSSGWLAYLLANYKTSDEIVSVTASKMVLLPAKLTTLHLNLLGACWSRSIRRYSEAVQADVMRRIILPMSSGWLRFSRNLGFTRKFFTNEADSAGFRGRRRQH
jgi:hypothetical protein